MAYPYRRYRSAFRRASRRRSRTTSTGTTFRSGGGNWDREVPVKGLGLGPTPNPNKPPYRPGASGLVFLAVGSVLSPAVLAIAVVGALAALFVRTTNKPRQVSAPEPLRPIPPAVPWPLRLIAALSYLATPVALWRLLRRSAPS